MINNRQINFNRFYKFAKLLWLNKFHTQIIVPIKNFDEKIQSTKIPQPIVVNRDKRMPQQLIAFFDEAAL